jgi:hypothetical protein
VFFLLEKATPTSPQGEKESLAWQVVDSSCKLTRGRRSRPDPSFYTGRGVTYATIALRTAIMPRWLALLGYAFALVLLSSEFLPWVELLFPFWVLIVSVHALIVVERSDLTTGSPHG